MVKETVYTKLESEAIQRIEQISNNLGLSKSDVIRLLIQAALALPFEQVIKLASQGQNEN